MTTQTDPRLEFISKMGIKESLARIEQICGELPVADQNVSDRKKRAAELERASKTREQEIELAALDEAIEMPAKAKADEVTARRKAHTEKKKREDEDYQKLLRERFVIDADVSMAEMRAGQLSREWMYHQLKLQTRVAILNFMGMTTGALQPKGGKDHA